MAIGLVKMDGCDLQDSRFGLAFLAEQEFLQCIFAFLPNSLKNYKLGDVYFLVLPLILNFFHIPLILFYHCILTKFVEQVWYNQKRQQFFMKGNK